MLQRVHPLQLTLCQLEKTLHSDCGSGRSVVADGDRHRSIPLRDYRDHLQESLTEQVATTNHSQVPDVFGGGIGNTGEYVGMNTLW